MPAKISTTVFRNIREKLRPNRHPVPSLRANVPLTRPQLKKRLQRLRKQKTADSAMQAELSVDRYLSSKRLESKYTEKSDRSILAKKLGRRSRNWVNGLRKTSRLKPGPDKFDHALTGLRIQDQFRLYIDHRHQSHGKLIFDAQEPGYARGMEAAFTLLRDHIGTPLTDETYKTLHDTAVKGVEKRYFVFDDDRFELGLGDGSFSYGINIKKVTPEARQEWKTEKLIWDSPDPLEDPNFLATLGLDEDGLDSVLPSHNDNFPKDILKQRLNRILEQYEGEIGQAKTDIEKKRIIARTCRALEIGHFFNDGNQRTVSFLVLNKMLIENNFKPTILEEPNVFDGYLSTDQLVQAIHQGQNIFQQCLHYAPSKFLAFDLLPLSSLRGRDY